jgi:hypothetical protein
MSADPGRAEFGPVDLGPVLEPLRADLATVPLTDPSVVRRRGDRRRSRTVVAMAVATAVVIGVTATAVALGASGRGGLPPGESHPPTATGPRLPTSSPTGPPPTTDGTDPTEEPPGPSASHPATSGVPDAAMLPELRSTESYESAQQYRTYLSPPRPCADGTRASDADRDRWRAGHGMMTDGDRPEVVIEYVAEFEFGSEGAARYFDELRDEARRCPGEVGSGIDRDDHSWTVVDSGFAGDESIVFRLRGSGRGYEPAPACCIDFYLAVVRDGDLLVALTSLGWEGGGSNPAFARRTATTGLAVARSGL